MKTLRFTLIISSLLFASTQHIYSCDHEQDDKSNTVSTCQKVSLCLSGAVAAFAGAAKFAAKRAVEPICKQLPNIKKVCGNIYTSKAECTAAYLAQKSGCDVKAINSMCTYTIYACLATGLCTVGYIIYTKAKGYTVVSKKHLVQLKHDHEMGKPGDDLKFD